jgi:ABC-2 type transport system ATP-binding protein
MHTAAPETAISVRGLRKRYGDIDAVRGVDLDIAHGEIFALLGPNGAGKTTLIEILGGFRARSAGEVSVLGADPQRAGRAWRERLGIVLQASEPDPGLTVREALALYAGYHPRPRRVDETLDLVALQDRADAVATSLSGGQRRRLDVALALIGNPELIFLDEPTTGFDPAARRAAWDMFAGLRDTGATIVLTTHQMDEAERLADRVAVLADGRVVAEGRPATLREREAAEIRFSLPVGLSAADLPPDLTPLATTTGAGVLTLRSDAPLVHLEALATWARAAGADIAELEVARPALEDVYLALAHPNGENTPS